jgi:phosphinothricin acetyltransferase
MADLQIRPARRSDLPILTEIYNHYIVNTAITFDLKPFTLEERAIWFDEHADTGRHRLLVGEEAGRVIGYASTGEFRNKRAYETTAETSIYCAPDVVGRGLGGTLYRGLFDAIRGEDLNRLAAWNHTAERRLGCAPQAFRFRSGGHIYRGWPKIWTLLGRCVVRASIRRFEINRQTTTSGHLCVRREGSRQCRT